MPPLPDVPGVLRITLVGSEDADVDIVQRFFYHYGGTAPTVTELNTFANSIGTNWNTDIAPVVPDDYSLTSCNIENLTSPTAGSVEVAQDYGGQLTGGALPLEAAMVVSSEIGRRYRGGHPRNYWRMGDDSKLATSQTWSSAFLSSANTAVGDFHVANIGDAWSGAGTVLVVSVSYYNLFSVVINPLTGRARNVPALRSTPIVDTVTSWVPRERIGAQRRRSGSS